MIAKILKKEGKIKCKHNTAKQIKESKDDSTIDQCLSWKEFHKNTSVIKELDFKNVKARAINCLLRNNSNIEGKILRYFIITWLFVLQLNK